VWSFTKDLNIQSDKLVRFDDRKEELFIRIPPLIGLLTKSGCDPNYRNNYN
jgi:hypothetical protein